MAASYVLGFVCLVLCIYYLSSFSGQPYSYLTDEEGTGNLSDLPKVAQQRQDLNPGSLIPMPILLKLLYHRVFLYYKKRTTLSSVRLG